MKPNFVIPAFVALLSVSVVAVSAQTASSTETPGDGGDMPKPTVSFAQAVEIATAEAEGDLVAMELDYPLGGPAYEAELLGDSSMTELVIDGMTGDILFSNIAKAASPELMEQIMVFDAQAGEFDLDDLRPGDEVPPALMHMLERMSDEERAALLLTAHPDLLDDLDDHAD